MSSDDLSDDFEATMLATMRAATEAKQWDVVGQIVQELKARRLARAGNVVQLPRRRDIAEE